MASRILIAVSLCVTLHLPSSRVAADETTLEQSADRGVQLREITELMSKKARKSRKIGGWSSIISGALVLGVAGWRIAGDTDGNDFLRGLGVMFIGLGTADVGAGVWLLAKESPEERLFGRLAGSGDATLTDVDIARLEGEFSSIATHRRREREVSRWVNLAKLIGGVAILGLTPFADTNKKSRRTGYIVGGVFMLTGGISFGGSFKESSTEKQWRAYRKLQGINY